MLDILEILKEKVGVTFYSQVQWAHLNRKHDSEIQEQLNFTTGKCLQLGHVGVTKPNI